MDLPSFPLFVPATRPDRIARALAAGTDAVIVDLEDAVAPEDKDAARGGPPDALSPRPGVALSLRINPVGTPWHEDDVAFLAGSPSGERFDGAMLPKTESAAQVERLRAAIGGRTVVALIESARGLDAAGEIAAAADRVAFGSIDFARNLGCAHTRLALLPARHRLVMAARIAGRPAPLDGVTTAIDDPAVTGDDAAHAAEMGFGGKLLIHPAQIDPARAAFRPSDEEVDWARRVLAAAPDGAAARVDGAMVDAPVVARARRILASSERPA